ncbi:MAG TPA: glycoside hydrolase family 3 N-terminal domain-containing protein, partial [Mycobacteriales bacterium]|nr:glycoside hydrolase family 3 N-terminal domain-containing protein [Mycobacteriales bacterium]
SCVQAADLPTAAAHASAGVGGVVVMGRPTDAAGLTASLTAVRRSGPHGIAPMIASDEEGGRVQRLQALLGPLPSAAVMGTWPDARIEQTAHAYGARMRALGVQMALSPVADLAAPGGYVAATGRGFSADPHRAAGAAAAWARGLLRAGVVPAVKHWPGHGGAGDSHDSAPTVPPVDVLAGRDLLPFDAVLRTGAGVVMVGHLRSPHLTEPGLPATLSPNAMRVLRQRAGPGAVVLTDSVSMAASSSAVGLTPPQAALRALQAGADWAMSCVDPLGAVATVHAALDQGRYPRAAAVASARRVLAVKQRTGLLRAPLTGLPPTGALEAAELVGGVLRLGGRADDPDAAAPPPVWVRVDGAVTYRLTADADARFAVEVPVAGPAQVCVEARGAAGERATALGCVAVPAG